MNPLRVEARLAARVWGGTRLGRGEDGQPIGEAWLLHEDSRVEGGPHAGRTLGDLAAEFPTELLGTRARGTRFPLLIKLLDCAEWLSVQVHPDDEQAARLVGPGELGKTEAWFILEAEPGAELIAGVREGTSPGELRAAILEGRVMDYAARQPVGAGDTVFMPAGTLHALGPGLFLYEVQQTSDTTYRVYDWDRPASAGRALHLAESAEVAVPRPCRPQPARLLGPGECRELLRCDQFVLEGLHVGARPLECDTRGESFHALTLTRGRVTLRAAGETLDLAPFDTVLLPAGLGSYTLEGESAEALVSRLP